MSTATAMTFKKATKKQSKLRLSIAGPSGSGKTFSALKLATEMGGKIAFIDTERGSAAKYSDLFEFDVIELEDFHPEKYIEAIKAAERAGYDILIIDSTTHEWNGKNGILELHEAAVQRQRTKNSYTAWAEVTPLHNDFINAILQCRCHVIASVRSTVDYVQEKNDQGKTEVKKVGMKSQQREGMDYEYDVMMEMNIDHVGIITKTRCSALDGKIFKKPGSEMAEILKSWLSDGAPVELAPLIDAETQKAIETLWPEHGVRFKNGNVMTIEEFLNSKNISGGIGDLPLELAQKTLAFLQENALKAQHPEPPKAEAGAGLDQWACGDRALALDIIQLTEDLEKLGIDEVTWRAELAVTNGKPDDFKMSRKGLTFAEAAAWRDTLKAWIISKS